MTTTASAEVKKSQKKAMHNLECFIFKLLIKNLSILLELGQFFSKNLMKNMTELFKYITVTQSGTEGR